MALDIFSGDHLPSLLAQARKTLGPEACVIQVRRRGGTFELIAAAETALAAPAVAPMSTSTIHEEQPSRRVEPDFAACLATELRPSDGREKQPTTEPSRRGNPIFAAVGSRLRPHIIALVGPTGSGKTTTIAKLASNPIAFAGKRVGLLGLDTWRVGAVDQLRAWGELAEASVEIAWDEVGLRRSALRLVECDVILVDTPGRGPREREARAEIENWLAMIRPDEVHLTLPAGEMPAVSRGHLANFRSLGVTHLLATKLDECPDAVRLFDIAAEAGYSMRWFTDGQAVPEDLHRADERLANAARNRIDRSRSVA